MLIYETAKLSVMPYVDIKICEYDKKKICYSYPDVLTLFTNAVQL